MSINARFEHLDSGQRNEIYHAVHGAGPGYGNSDNCFLLLSAPERRTMVRRMARRFGVKQATVEAVYAYLHIKNGPRRRQQRIATAAIEGRLL